MDKKSYSTPEGYSAQPSKTNSNANANARKTKWLIATASIAVFVAVGFFGVWYGLKQVLPGPSYEEKEIQGTVSTVDVEANAITISTNNNQSLIFRVDQETEILLMPEGTSLRFDKAFGRPVLLDDLKVGSDILIKTSQEETTIVFLENADEVTNENYIKGRVISFDQISNEIAIEVTPKLITPNAPESIGEIYEPASTTTYTYFVTEDTKFFVSSEHIDELDIDSYEKIDTGDIVVGNTVLVAASSETVDVFSELVPLKYIVVLNY